jgi:hypothetical protein
MAGQKDNKATGMRIGIAWYRPEQWEHLRRVAPDADKLEVSFEAWHAHAEKMVDRLRREGYIVHKVDIDMAEFLSWCKMVGLEPDAAARSKYTSEYEIHRA